MPWFTTRSPPKVVATVPHPVVLKLVKFWLSSVFTRRLVPKKRACHRAVGGLLGLLFVYQPLLPLAVRLVSGAAKVGELRQVHVPRLLVNDAAWPLAPLAFAVLVALVVWLVALF